MKETMNYDEEIEALLDENQAAVMLAKVGLKIDNQRTKRDLQLLVAEYGAKASDSDELCRLLRITRDSSEAFLVEDALMEKGDLELAQSIIAKTPPSALPAIMENLVNLAVTVIAPRNQALIDFIKFKRKELTPRASMQFEMWQTHVSTKEQQPANLVNLMASRVIAHPNDCRIFELCHFIRSEAKHLAQLRVNSEEAEKKQTSAATVSLKNATMKLQQHNHSQESLDKFLQRLEKATSVFARDGKARPLLEVLGAYKADSFPATSDCAKLIMEAMTSALNEQMSEAAAVARLNIACNKLIQKQLDSGPLINIKLLRAALQTKTDSTAAKLIDEAMARAKCQPLRLAILQFAATYFHPSHPRHHDYMSQVATLKWEIRLETFGLKTRLNGEGARVEGVCYDLLGKSSVSLEFVKSFCNEMRISPSDFFFGYLKYHLLGEQSTDFLSKDNGALVSVSKRHSPFSGSVQSLVTAAVWSQTSKRLGEIIRMFIDQHNVAGVLDVLTEAFALVDKNEYTRIRFILDQINEVTAITQTMNVSLNHSRLRRLLDVFSSYKRIRPDGTEIRIPFLVDDTAELQQCVVSELKPANFFELLPIATSELVGMPRHQFILKAIAKCDNLTLDKTQLDHYAAILKVNAAGAEREAEIRMATRGYKFIMQRIESPTTRLAWIGVARRELERELGACSSSHENEIYQLLALDKLLQIEQKIEFYGLFSPSVRDMTKVWMAQNIVDISKQMVIELFELIYLEFFVPPFDKQLTKALDDVCQIAGAKVRKVHAELLFRFIASIPANIDAAKSIIEVGNKAESAQVLFLVIQSSEDDATKAAVFTMILAFFDEDEIRAAASEMGAASVGASQIQDLVFMHALFAECNQAGIRMNKKLFQTLLKQPAKVVKQLLEGMSDTQEGLLIIIDLCIRFAIADDKIWIVLFETISQSDALIDRLVMLNTSEWFQSLHLKSKALYDHYHMAWNKTLLGLYDAEPDRAILAFFQFRRPIRLDTQRLFNHALAAGSPVHCMQIIVRSKLVQRRRMMDALIDQSSLTSSGGGVCSLLELIKERPFIGSHDALRYLLWSVKKGDFAQMDKAVARWVKSKLIEYGHIHVYVDYLVQTRQNQDLLSFVLDFAKTDKSFGLHLSTLRNLDEMAKLDNVQKYFARQSSVADYFTITA